MTNETVTPKQGFVFSDKLYGRLKNFALITLPALTSLFFAFGEIWHLPRVDEIVGSMTAIDAFLGIILGISTKSYNASDAKYDGAVVLSQKEDGTKVYSLEVHSTTIDDLDSKKELIFKMAPGEMLE